MVPAGHGPVAIVMLPGAAAAVVAAAAAAAADDAADDEEEDGDNGEPDEDAEDEVRVEQLPAPLTLAHLRVCATTRGNNAGLWGVGFISEEEPSNWGWRSPRVMMPGDVQQNKQKRQRKMIEARVSSTSGLCQTDVIRKQVDTQKCSATNKRRQCSVFTNL